MDLSRECTNELKCEYCGKSYKNARAFQVHLCTKKQRILQKNEKRVRYGLYAYNRFNRLSQGKKAEVSYEEFCNSRYYNAFVKFGSYLTNVRPLYTERYIDYVVTSGIKINDWCNDETYQRYVIDLIKKESADVAIQRTIQTMMDWATEKNDSWFNYFDHVNRNVALWNIKDGKISPWVLLNTNKGKSLLSNYDDHELEILYPLIDPDFWAITFKRKPQEVHMVHILAEEYGL